jgi:hypothetical protein
MKPIIDFGSELLVDRTRIRSPYLQLLLAAIGRELARGSAWVTVNKAAVALYFIPPELIHRDARVLDG